jgi:hypothetical protein
MIREERQRIGVIIHVAIIDGEHDRARERQEIRAVPAREIVEAQDAIATATDGAARVVLRAQVLADERGSGWKADDRGRIRECLDAPRLSLVYYDARNV